MPTVFLLVCWGWVGQGLDNTSCGSRRLRVGQLLSSKSAMSRRGMRRIQSECFPLKPERGAVFILSMRPPMLSAFEDDKPTSHYEFRLDECISDFAQNENIIALRHGSDWIASGLRSWAIAEQSGRRPKALRSFVLPPESGQASLAQPLG